MNHDDHLTALQKVIDIEFTNALTTDPFLSSFELVRTYHNKNDVLIEYHIFGEARHYVIASLMSTPNLQMLSVHRTHFPNFSAVIEFDDENWLEQTKAILKRMLCNEQ